MSPTSYRPALSRAISERGAIIVLFYGFVKEDNLWYNNGRFYLFEGEHFA